MNEQVKSNSKFSNYFTSFLLRATIFNITILVYTLLSYYFLNNATPFFETKFWATIIAINGVVFFITAVIWQDWNIYLYPIIFIPLIISFVVWTI